MGFFEWVGRVIMLVLAGMITLSIIGAIAAIPSGGLPERIGMTEREPSVPPANAPTPAPRPRPGGEAVEAPSGDIDPSGAGIAPAAPKPIEPAEWLEAITYALLALVGLAALATLLLWRMLHQRRRIADALEAMAARPIPSGRDS